MERSPIKIAVTRADFTRTSVTNPSVAGQSNSIPTNFLLSAPKEVFTSKFRLKGGNSCYHQSKHFHSSIPGTSDKFKCGLGLERGPPSLVRTIG